MPHGAPPIAATANNKVDETVFGTRILTVIDFGVANRPNATAKINMSIPIHGTSAVLAAGDNNATSRLYTFRACSVLPYAAYADGYQRINDPIFNWSNLVDLYSTVGKVDFSDVYNELPDGGRSNTQGEPIIRSVDNFWRLPVSIANATCVQYGFSVYIIGGVELDPKSPTPKFRHRLNIDKIDLSKKAREIPTYFTANVAFLPSQLAPHNKSGAAVCSNPEILDRMGAAASSAAIYMAFVCQNPYSIAPSVYLYALYPTYNNTIVETIEATELVRWGTQLFAPQLSVFGEHVYLTDTGSLYQFDASMPGEGYWVIEDIGSSLTSTGFALSASVVDASWEEGCVLSMFAVGGVNTNGVPTNTVEVTKMDDKEPSIELVTVPASSTLNGDGYAWVPGALGSIVLPAGQPIQLKMSSATGSDNCLIRVSADPTCSSPIVGLQGEPGDFPWDINQDVVTITIPRSSPVVFFCVSTGKYADVPINISLAADSMSHDTLSSKAEANHLSEIFYEHIFLFTCVSCSTFASAVHVPSEDHGGNSDTKWLRKPTSILIVAGSASVVALFIAIVLRRFYKFHRQLMDYVSMSHREQVARLNISSSGKYVILKKLGQGGNGEVFLVKRKDDDSGQEYAVKHVRVIGKSDRDSTLKETDLVSSFQSHPNVIKIIEMSLTEQYVLVDSVDPTAAVIAKAMQIVRQRRQLLGETLSDVEETETLFQNTIANKQWSGNGNHTVENGYLDNNDSFTGDLNSGINFSENTHHQPHRFRPSGLRSSDRISDEGESSVRSSSSSCSSFSTAGLVGGTGYDETTSLVSKNKKVQRRADRNQRKQDKKSLKSANTANTNKSKKQAAAARVRFQCVVMEYCKRSSLDAYLMKAAKKGGELWNIFAAATADAREKQHHQQQVMRADKNNPFIPPLSPTSYDIAAVGGVNHYHHGTDYAKLPPQALPESSSYSATGSNYGYTPAPAGTTANNTSNTFNSIYGSLVEIGNMSPSYAGMTNSNNSLLPTFHQGSTNSATINVSATGIAALAAHNPHNPHSPFATIPEAAVISIGIQVLSVLQHLHTAIPNPIAHCDIKLANILVADKIDQEFLTSGVPTSVVRRFGAEIEGADDRVRRMMRKQHLHHFKCYDMHTLGSTASPSTASNSSPTRAVSPQRGRHSQLSPKPSPLVGIDSVDDMPISTHTNGAGSGGGGHDNLSSSSHNKRMGTRETLISNAGSVFGGDRDGAITRRESVTMHYPNKKLKDSICSTFIPIVVTDLGMATECPPAQAKQGSIVLGAFTVAYVPPECIASGLRHCSTKVDIWALGVTLYLIATGKFDGMEDLKELAEIERRLDGSFYKNSNSHLGKVGVTPRRHHGRHHQAEDKKKHHHHSAVSVDSLEDDDAADTTDQLVEVLMFEKARSQRFLQKVRIELVEMHGYSEAFSAWIESMLTVDPSRRPNAAELLYRVQRVGWLEYRVLPPRINSNQLPSAANLFSATGTPPINAATRTSIAGIGTPTTQMTPSGGGGLAAAGQEEQGSYTNPFTISQTKAPIMGDSTSSYPYTAAPMRQNPQHLQQHASMSMDEPFTLPESVGAVRQSNQNQSKEGLLNAVPRRGA